MDSLDFEDILDYLDFSKPLDFWEWMFLLSYEDQQAIILLLAIRKLFRSDFWKTTDHPYKLTMMWS